MFFRKPTNTKDWASDQAILPRVTVKGNLALIQNIRDFEYKSEFLYTENFLNKEFNLEKIQSVDLLLVPFTFVPLIAHTLLCFNFEDAEHLVFSIEVRKTKAQQKKFSAWQSLFNNFELMYVISTEEDALKLRTNLRTDEPAHYLHRLNISKNDAKLLFLDLANRANGLAENPEFFNLIYNSCSSNLFKHLNKVLKTKIPAFYRYLAPGLLNHYLYKNKIIIYPVETNYKRFLERSNITSRARKASANYSEAIRTHLN